MKLKAVFLPRTSHEEDLSYFEARNEDFPLGSTVSPQKVTFFGIASYFITDEIREMGKSWEDLDEVPVVAGDLDTSVIGMSLDVIDSF